MHNDLLVLEQNKSFSKSVLWQWHQDFYLQSGIHAWEKSVPHYVTSNPFIANAYAEIILEFKSEWLTNNPCNSNYPFYLLELGAGHGVFSFYLLSRLVELRNRWPVGLRICYVISDFSEKNLEFTSSHSNFKAYIEEGILDFALFDLEKCNSIELKMAHRCLGEDDFKNPLIVCANYVLDSIGKDSFYIDDRSRLVESLITVKTKESNLKDGKPLDLHELVINFSSSFVAKDYYKEKILNDILLVYNQTLKKKSFLLPTSAFRLINHLDKLSNGQLFFITSDKGHVQIDDFSSSSSPHIAFHGGCFSLMTNFDAVARYFKALGGDAFMQYSHSGLATCTYLTGTKLADIPRTKANLEKYIHQLSPQDYFNLYEELVKNKANISLENIVSALKLSCADPHLFNQFYRKIIDSLAMAEYSVKVSLKRILRQVADHFYYIPGTVDNLFNVALCFHTLLDYEDALYYYQKSEQFFGARFNTYYNSGLCYYHLYQWHEAELCFVKALELKTDSKAKEWLRHTRKKNGRR